MIFTNEVRATVSAIMLLAVNLGGVSLGTLLPGLFDDHLFHGEQMLGRSMALTAVLACAIGIVAALLSFRPYRRDVAASRVA
jgi:hypothetical protein